MGKAESAKTSAGKAAPSAGPAQGGRRGEVDLGLFGQGGPFAGYVGPALVAGPNGVVLAANPAAGPVADLIKSGEAAELRTAIETALAGKAAQVNPLLLPAGGGTRALEATALPWGEGAAALLLCRDITLERTRRQALMDSHQRLKDVVGLLEPDFAWETDAEGRFTYVSPNGACGRGAAELVGRPASELAADPAAARQVFRADTAQTGVPLDLVDPEEQPVHVLASAVPLHDGNGRRTGARGLCRDITDTLQGEREVRRARHRQQLLAAILRVAREDPAPQAILDIAAEGLLPALGADGASVYRRVDGRFLRVATAGSPPPEDELQRLLMRLEAGAREAEGGDGDNAVLARATVVRETVNGALCLWHMASDGHGWSDDDRGLIEELAAQIAVANRQLAREEELTRLSATDPLTGLTNRRAFLEGLEQRRADPEARARPAALIYLDLDNFKLINDRQGHQAGDDILLAVARLLRGHAREGDVTARLGGDEFAVFLDGIPAEVAAQRAHTLAEAARSAFDTDTGDPNQPFGFSLGVALWPAGAEESVSALLERADRAMYRAKEAGKGGVVMADE